MTNLEIAKDQLELALQEIKNTLTVEQGELIHDYVFEALKQVKNCSIPVVVKSFTADEVLKVLKDVWTITEAISYFENNT